MQKKITAKSLRTIKPGQTIRDTEQPGFLVQAGKRGHASYKLQADLWQGERGQRRLVRTIRHTFAAVHEMAPDEARNVARGYLSQIKRGTDPFRNGVSKKRKTWTVAEAFEEYARKSHPRPLSDRTKRDLQVRLDRYLADWKTLPIDSIDPHMASEKHRRLVEDHGPHAANSSLRWFRAVYNVYAAEFERSNPPPNPVRVLGRKWAPEARQHRAIALVDLSAWEARRLALPSKLRREMHLLGLLSGLRPSNLVAIERAWVDLPGRKVSFPAEAMKSRKAFSMPLSAPMVTCLERSLAASEALFEGSRFVFPTRNNDGHVVPTVVWRESGLKHPTTKVQECGYALRHTFAAIALDVPGVSYAMREILMARQIADGGAGVVYSSPDAMLPALLAAQELISKRIVALLEKK